MTIDILNLLDRATAPNSDHSVLPSDEGLDKVAQSMQRRQAELEGEGSDAFALVVWDGYEQRRKYPVKTASDIRLSKQLLDVAADRLPHEIVKQAQFHIDLAAREVMGESLYPDTGESFATNVLYTEDIDQDAFREKLEGKTASSADAYILNGRFPVTTEEHVREAEAHFRAGLGVSPVEEIEAAEKLASRAEEIGVEIKEASVTRYLRDQVPPSFQTRLMARKENAPEDLHGFYDELTEKSASAGRPGEMTLSEVAQCVELLDKHAGFVLEDGEYNSKLASNTRGPYEMVFPVGEEIAEEKTASAHDETEKLAGFFDADFLESFRSDRDAALESLSSSERQLADGLLSGTY